MTGREVSQRDNAMQNLNVAVYEAQRWPTPTSQDGANNGGSSQYERNSLPLNAIVQQRGSGLALNPDWTESLMGAPIGWTSLAPLPLDAPWPALDGAWPAPPGPQHAWEPPRVAAGVEHRAKGLRCIGNAQVPFTAALAWRVLGDE